MVSDKTKAILNKTGKELASHLPGFFGRVIFNYQNGVYGFSTVEQSIKPDNLKKGVKK